MVTTITPVSLDGFSDQDIEHIQSEADRRGCTFDDAMKQIMLERIRSMRNRPLSQKVARLFRFPTVH